MSPELYEFLRQFISQNRLQRFHEVVAHRTRQVTVVLQNIYHGHNASACLRTCDCFGVQDAHIIESQNSFEPNQEIALGASKWLTIRRYRSEAGKIDLRSSTEDAATAECIQHLKDRGYRILATSPRQHSVPLNDVVVKAPTAVIFGAEQLGVSEYAMRSADELVHIPMFGFTESLNVSVSVALVLQHLTGQLQAAGDLWKLSDAEQRQLLAEWVWRSLGNKAGSLRRRFEAEQQS